MAMLIEVLNIDDILNIHQLYSKEKQNNKEIALINPERSSSYLGLGYLKVLMEEADKYGFDFICNVADNSGLAQAAFRMGFKKVYYSGNSITYSKLASIAQQYQTQLIRANEI